ncbi:galactokinase [Virgibacillus sp. DJP39]|uniref:galactokinase n=1 Tax=Virgibacillus sp. DJP39 TaxID=3409790 RepID=UPI003BB4A4C6
MDISRLKKKFAVIFNRQVDPRVFFAPGRINLIGEHTDYNGGNVFPAAISFGTYAVAAKRKDDALRFYSMNFPELGVMECKLSDLDYQESQAWANYPKGMIRFLKNEGHSITTGADILYFGDIPNGAGLSSSASIEMVTGVVMENLYLLEIDRIRMIQLGQLVENKYIGVQSGIMDQFAIGKGKKDHAILLDCKTLAFEYAPLQLEDYVIVIIHTNKRRELAGSAYNERRLACERALSDLQRSLNITTLGELTTDQFEQHRYLIDNEVDRKRANHAVYENARTIKALEVLKECDLQSFGQLMNESHQSLKNDYQVTGVELDTIVEAAWQQPGVLGARMTGAGFGGCAIALVLKGKVDDFKENVNRIYNDQIGYDATFYLPTISDGAREIVLKE